MPWCGEGQGCRAAWHLCGLTWQSWPAACPCGTWPGPPYPPLTPYWPLSPAGLHWSGLHNCKAHHVTMLSTTLCLTSSENFLMTEVGVGGVGVGDDGDVVILRRHHCCTIWVKNTSYTESFLLRRDCPHLEWSWWELPGVLLRVAMWGKLWGSGWCLLLEKERQSGLEKGSRMYMSTWEHLFFIIYNSLHLGVIVT